MNTPLVSWLMPVRNGEKTIRRALDSMIDQTYKNYEIIIINDGSTDNTSAILNDYVDKKLRIRIWHNEKNLGIANSLNIGLDLCNGDYIARMDADDVSYCDRLEKQVRFMEENPDVDILASQVRVVNISAQSEQISDWLDNESIKARLLFSCCICHPSVMIRREMLIRNNLRYPDCEAEDYALWASLISKAGISIFPEPLVEYHIHGDNVCTVRFGKIQNCMVKTSRRAISIELGLDLSGFPDCLFGWRERAPIPDDLCSFLSSSAKLLQMINDANNQLIKIDKEALHETLKRQWKLSKHVAGMNSLPDSYEAFTEASYKVALSYFNCMSESITRAVIYGIGKYSKYILQSLGDKFPFEITAFVDADKNKQGTGFFGHEVLPPEKLPELSYDYVLIGTTIYYDEVKRFLVYEMGIPENKILSLEIANDIEFHLSKHCINAI